MGSELIKASLVSVENVNIPIVFEGKSAEIKFGKLCFFLGVITLIASQLLALGQGVDLLGIALIVAAMILYGVKPKIVR